MYMYMRERKRETEQCKIGKTLVNATNVPTSFSQWFAVFVILKSMLNYLTSPSDINVKYLIHRQREGAVVLHAMELT